MSERTQSLLQMKDKISELNERAEEVSKKIEELKKALKPNSDKGNKPKKPD